MKIIGKTQNGFILDASSAEVARLIGYYSYTKTVGKLNVGAEIAVNSMYNQLYQLSYAKVRLKETQSKLRSVADTLEEVDPIIPDIKVPKND